MFVLNKIYNFLREFFFLRKYRKDTLQDTLNFYNRMKLFYKTEFNNRKKFFKKENNFQLIDALERDGFRILQLTDISNSEVFFNSINKFRDKFDEINQNHTNLIASQKNYLITYNFEYNQNVKNIADPFVDIATQYLGTLPILNACQLWYSPNTSDKLLGSKLLHIDGEDYKQLKVFIPIEEIQSENGPLNVINKQDTKKIYKNLIDQKVINRRNQKINDKHIEKLNYKLNKIIVSKDQCALVDTCACYHYGSRKSSKPRKLLILHFTTAFSAKTPIFRNYDKQKNFLSEKDKLVYGLQKQLISHNKKTIYYTL